MKIIFLFVITAATSSVYAQIENTETFEFYRDSDVLAQVDVEAASAEDHKLGNEIAAKLNLLRDTYTWVQEPTPTRPAPVRNVEKPHIYYNLKKLERYYKKGVKKGKFELQQVQKEFSQILDIALMIRHQSTEDLEEKLKSLKEEEEMARVFTQRIALK